MTDFRAGFAVNRSLPWTLIRACHSGRSGVVRSARRGPNLANRAADRGSADP